MAAEINLDYLLDGLTTINDCYRQATTALTRADEEKAIAKGGLAACDVLEMLSGHDELWDKLAWHGRTGSHSQRTTRNPRGSSHAEVEQLSKFLQDPRLAKLLVRLRFRPPEAAGQLLRDTHDLLHGGVQMPAAEGPEQAVRQAQEAVEQLRTETCRRGRRARGQQQGMHWLRLVRNTLGGVLLSALVIPEVQQWVANFPEALDLFRGLTRRAEGSLDALLMAGVITASSNANDGIKSAVELMQSVSSAMGNRLPRPRQGPASAPSSTRASSRVSAPGREGRGRANRPGTATSSPTGRPKPTKRNQPSAGPGDNNPPRSPGMTAC